MLELRSRGMNDSQKGVAKDGKIEREREREREKEEERRRKRREREKGCEDTSC